MRIQPTLEGKDIAFKAVFEALDEQHLMIFPCRSLLHFEELFGDALHASAAPVRFIVAVEGARSNTLVFKGVEQIAQLDAPPYVFLHSCPRCRWPSSNIEWPSQITRSPEAGALSS